MEGVTILGSEVVMKVNPLFVTYGLIGIGILVLGLILGIIYRKDEGAFVMFISLIIGALVGFGGMGWASINKVEDYVKYDVLVSENVIFQEFYNKYEILEAKGDVYTVRVREIEVND